MSASASSRNSDYGNTWTSVRRLCYTPLYKYNIRVRNRILLFYGNLRILFELLTAAMFLDRYLLLSLGTTPCHRLRRYNVLYYNVTVLVDSSKRAQNNT